jgi:hypothetical protein
MKKKEGNDSFQFDQESRDSQILDCRRVEPMKTPPSTNTPTYPNPVTMRARGGKNQIPRI